MTNRTFSDTIGMIRSIKFGDRTQQVKSREYLKKILNFLKEIIKSEFTTDSDRKVFV